MAKHRSHSVEFKRQVSQDYLGGKEKVFGALMGTVMKELKGKGDPAVVKEILMAKLAALKS